MRTNPKKNAPPAAGGKKSRKVRGAVYLDEVRCKGCGFCIEFCPQDVLEFSEEFNEKGYHPPRVVRLEDCTGCDLCGLYCPDFAIYGVMTRESLSVPTGAPSGSVKESSP